MATKGRWMVEPASRRTRCIVRNFSEHDEIGAVIASTSRAARSSTSGAERWTRRVGAHTTRHAAAGVLVDKGATASCVTPVAARSDDLDTPSRRTGLSSQQWQESIPVRWLVSHKAGLRPSTSNWLATRSSRGTHRRSPRSAGALWEPGSAHGYHALTFGWVLGELIRRVDGRGLGQFFARRSAGPLGLEFWIGLPESQEHRRRARPLAACCPTAARSRLSSKSCFDQFVRPDSLLRRALTLNGVFDIPDGTRVRAPAEIGAANGITNARLAVRMYAGSSASCRHARRGRCSECADRASGQRRRRNDR